MCPAGRSEEPGDITAIRRVNEAAFGRPDEADLVDRLRSADADLLSLVGVVDGSVVAHVLFTTVNIAVDEGGRSIAGASLGPVAVLPEFQRRGIGSALIQAGLTEMEQQHGCPFIVVLGHPEYYPRFGFVPARPRYGIHCKWNVPDEAFMIRVFDPTVLAGITGLAEYHPAFDAV